MSKRSIGIDRLDVRLKGVSARAARSAVGGLGRELMGQLTAARQGPHGPRGGRIGNVDSGTVRVATGATPAELRRTIAGAIAAAINSKPK